MPRPITLFTGQWADLPLEQLAPLAKKMGYDGLELACWGDHFDVRRALSEPGYVPERLGILEQNGLKCYAIGNHLVGQAVCDPIDARHKNTLPAYVWGDGDPEGVHMRAAQELMDTARAAKLMGAGVVTGFTGSSIWHKFYFFPPTTEAEVEAGFEDFARRFNPILDVFDAQGVKFALEVHPTEIAYDILTSRRALAAVGNRPAFGFNFDPSHLYWQFVDPAKFIMSFPERIYHVHMKDAARTINGEGSILGSHLGFGEYGRAWDFRSVGRGDVDFQSIIRALNRVRYSGPLSVEWEDAGMEREQGGPESAAFVRALDFQPSERAFDAAFGSE